MASAAHALTDVEQSAFVVARLWLNRFSAKDLDYGLCTSEVQGHRYAVWDGLAETHGCWAVIREDKREISFISGWVVIQPVASYEAGVIYLAELLRGIGVSG